MHLAQLQLTYKMWDFYFCQFIKSCRLFHSFWKEGDLSRKINTSCIEWHIIIIITIQFQSHPANRAVAHLNFFVVFINLCSLKKISKAVSYEYLINIELIWLLPQNTSQNFCMAWHAILCSIGYIDVPDKGIVESNKRTINQVTVNAV